MNYISVKALYRTCWLLRFTYGFYWGIIGLDKFFGYVTESQNRVSSLVLTTSPISLTHFLQFIGLLELIIAFLILTRWTRLGTILGIVLMGMIVINLVAMGRHYDIAIHGTTIGIGMIAFLVLTNALKKSS